MPEIAEIGDAFRGVPSELRAAIVAGLQLYVEAMKDPACRTHLVEAVLDRVDGRESAYASAADWPGWSDAAVELSDGVVLPEGFGEWLEGQDYERYRSVTQAIVLLRGAVSEFHREAPR